MRWSRRAEELLKSFEMRLQTKGCCIPVVVDSSGQSWGWGMYPLAWAYFGDCMTVETRALYCPWRLEDLMGVVQMFHCYWETVAEIVTARCGVDSSRIEVYVEPPVKENVYTVIILWKKKLSERETLLLVRRDRPKDLLWDMPVDLGKDLLKDYRELCRLLVNRK